MLMKVGKSIGAVASMMDSCEWFKNFFSKKLHLTFKYYYAIFQITMRHRYTALISIWSENAETPEPNSKEICCSG